MSRTDCLHWTGDQEAAIVDGFHKGLNDQEIKDAYNLPFTANAIRCKRSRMNLVSKRHSEYMKESCAQRRQERAARCLQSASIWHLVDLKRAGHSPTRTEWIVPSEGLPVSLAALVEG
jgi:hypothetical protein